MTRSIVFCITALASTAAAQPRQHLQASGDTGREIAQETFNAMLPRLEPEVGNKLHDAWNAVDHQFGLRRGRSSVVSVTGSRVEATLGDGADRRATRHLQWDWHAAEGRVRIEHDQADGSSLMVARIRPGSQLLVSRMEKRGGLGIHAQAVRVTRRPGWVSSSLARRLASRLPWRRKGVARELSPEVRQALARPGAAYTIVTYHTRTSRQAQPSLPRGSRPPNQVTRDVFRRIVVGNMNAPLSAAGARELRARR